MPEANKRSVAQPRLDRIEKMIGQSRRAGREAHARHERAIAARARRRFDERITQLAGAQVVTEKKLQLYFSSLGRSGNGKGKHKR